MKLFYQFVPSRTLKLNPYYCYYHSVSQLQHWQHHQWKHCSDDTLLLLLFLLLLLLLLLWRCSIWMLVVGTFEWVCHDLLVSYYVAFCCCRRRPTRHLLSRCCILHPFIWSACVWGGGENALKPRCSLARSLLHFCCVSMCRLCLFFVWCARN